MYVLFPHLRITCLHTSFFLRETLLLSVRPSFLVCLWQQLTFSQIDNTVLGALPPDLRQEVTAQLEARQRQRHENATTSSPPTANRAGASGEEKERVAHWSAGSKVEGASAAAYRAEATGGMASAEVVREGFDLTVREGSVKPHQVTV